MLLNNFYNIYNYFSYNGRLSLLDLVLFPIYVFIIYIFAKRTQNNHIEKCPEYKYYIKGLFAKIIGVIGFSIIYAYYYDGGDTFVYFNNASGLTTIAFSDTSSFLSIMSGNMSHENFLIFEKYNYQLFYWKDPQAFSVIKLVVPFAFLGLKCYLLTSIIVAYITYSGVWKLYQMFVKCFPNMKKEIAIAILFMPSVAFWGSGVLKDSWTLSAAGWLTYSFYNIFIKIEKKSLFLNIINVIISSYILFSIKPYILFSLIFGYVIWVIFHKFTSIKSNFHRVLLFPTIFILSWFMGAAIITQTGSVIGGSYENIDKMVVKADVGRKDHLRSIQYGGNNFDIGEYDKNSFTSILKKVPIAIISGLFRPFLWECSNIVMLLSGLENLVVIIFTIFIIFRKGPLFLINTLFDNPLILFSFVFAIVFAFSIGFSTSNFGALVRYKIPLIPFFMAALFFVRKKQITVAIEDEKRKQIYIPQRGLKV